MSDIEIEEHDVLDDPTLRRLFPDLSVIKKEISEYEEGLNPTLEKTPQAATVDNTALDEKPIVKESLELASNSPKDPKSHEDPQRTVINDRSEIHQRFKTFLDSLADDTSLNTDVTYILSGTSNQYFNDNCSVSPLSWSKPVESPAKKIKHVKNNIFILGSKPSARHSESHKEKRHINIVLQNISSYLNNSKRYCKHCCILFPNIDAFKYHLNQLHSPRSNNKKEQVGLKSPESKFECDVCSISISTRSNLMRHLRTVHKHLTSNIRSRKNTKNDKRQILEGNKMSKETKVPSTSGNKNQLNVVHQQRCFHCSKMFATQSSLIEHIYDVLNPNKTASVNSVESEKPSISRNTIIDKNKDAMTPKNNECTSCAIKFATQKLLDQHNSESHSNNKIEIATMNKIIQDNFQKFKPVNSIESNELKSIEDKSSIHAIKENGVAITSITTDIAEHKLLNESESHNETVPDNESTDNYVSDSEPNTKNKIKKQKKYKISDMKIHKQEVYQCFVCSQYMGYFTPFSNHMDAIHNIKEISRGERIVFESQCKFCSLKLSNIYRYNAHIIKCHNDMYLKKIPDDITFYSVLFQCVKCDVFFLSATVAKCHSEHETFSIHWRCLKCQRLFKLKDKSRHLKQHLYYEDFTAYALDESALNRVLYKCLNCAVHFSEGNYFLHYTSCNLQIPNATYCNVCDILVNKNDMVLHERNHKENNYQSFDFTLIESKVIMSDEKSYANIKSKFALTFCQNCNMFVSSLSSQHNIHKEGRCNTMVNSRLCYQCGLVFTSNGYKSHGMLHKEMQNLNLQTFYFYDIMNYKTQIRPPIPKYPNCMICGVHFLKKSSIKKHQCENQKYRSCKICKIKLVKSAFILHTNFHNYKLSSSMINKENIARSNIGKLVTNSNKNNSIYKHVTNILYKCISCNSTTNTYDDVVLHCHDHYDYSKQIKVIEDKNTRSGEDKFSLKIKYDPFYFRFDNEAWIKHIFVNQSKEQINNILENSLYKFECRFKMYEIQPGTCSSVLHKCAICRVYIDRKDLYSHAGKTKCTTAKKYPCSLCGLCFSTSSFILVHEKLIHSSPSPTTINYKLILFNKHADKPFTEIMVQAPNTYILYQCRTCEGVVDKLHRDKHQCHVTELIKCSFCGLLIYIEDFISHRSKHTSINNFQPKNMIVVLFGKAEVQAENKLKPSFKGAVYDLTFYKCLTCELCVTSMNRKYRHFCVFDSMKSQCPNCFLYFLPKDLEEHLELHESILAVGHDDFNSNVITFDSSKVKVYRKVNKVQSNNDPNKKDKTEANEIESVAIVDNIYKCECGLHFLVELNARKHNSSCNPRTKMSKQNCFKCNLLFTPGELFNHLLKHHGDKKVKYKYDVINVYEELKT